LGSRKTKAHFRTARKYAEVLFRPLLLAALALRERQVEQLPDAPSHLAARADVLNRLCAVYCEDGRLDLAAQAVSEALASAQALCDKYPRETAFALALAASHQSRGELHRVNGAFDQAAVDARAALDLLARVLKTNPQHAQANELLIAATATRNASNRIK
jgi:tetratricopeptide (TPR) repeat protein